MNFLIFPDHELAARVAVDTVWPDGTKVIRHPASGRPWLVGSWDEQELLIIDGHDRRLVAFGVTESPSDAGNRLDRLAGVAEAEVLFRAFPGDRHLILSHSGAVRAQGTLSSSRQLFWARHRGFDLAADCADTLITLTGIEVDADAIAVRLLAPWAPWPFAEQPLWHGLSALRQGHWLTWDANGRAVSKRWWSPPTPDRPLAEAARATGEALDEAVRVRTSQHAVSADLSGGLDSTSLSFLLAPHHRDLTLTSWEATNPADEDQVWAARAADRLDGRHRIMRRAEAPGWFSDLDGHAELEGPFAWVRTRGKLRHQAELLAAAGSSVHLTGHGGDELFTGTPLYLADLIGRPLRALPYVKAFRAMHRWSSADTVRALARRESLSDWLARAAGMIDQPIDEYLSKPDLGWGIGYRMPRWATAEAISAARARLLAVAQTNLAPLGPSRSLHTLLQDVRLCGDTIRRVSRWTEQSGVAWHAPMIDDAVVEAACSVDPAEVAMPDRYKPLLTEAMRGRIPAEFLGRRTKSEYSAEAYDGVRRERPQLLAFCEDSELERRGLIDATRLRDLIIRPPQSSFDFVPLISTLAVEAWLRTVRAAALTKDHRTHGVRLSLMTNQGGL